MRQETKSSPMMVRQGDVLMVPIRVQDSELEPAPVDPRGLVLAEGETSGHHHALYGSGAKLMRFRATGRMVAVVDGGGDMRVIGGGSGGVDRHTPVKLAPGRYEIRLQKTWDSARASRTVQD